MPLQELQPVIVDTGDEERAIDGRLDSAGGSWGGGSGGGGSGGGGSAGGGGGSGGGGTSRLELQGLNVFPQITLSVAQGQTGVRRWYLNCVKHQSTLKQTLRVVCASHWPGQPDCVPISVQAGSPDEKAIVQGNIGIHRLSTELETFDTYLIVAQYQLLHISDPWPVTGKPAHPKGTVLTLQVRGGAEMLKVDPNLITNGAGTGLSGCLSGKELMADKTFNSRIRIPLTEYHITCDRLTDQDLCEIMSKSVSWKTREGTVNCDTPASPPHFAYFMNEPEGTLMFDTWTLDQTFAPDVDNPRRWRLGCVLKCRNIEMTKAPYPEDCKKAKYPMGWNHDFKRDTEGDLGWKFIMMQDPSVADWGRRTPHGDCPKGFAPRYPYLQFYDLFCDMTHRDCTPNQAPTYPETKEPYGCGNGGGGDSGFGSGGGGSGGGGSMAAVEEIISRTFYDARKAPGRKMERDARLGIIEP
jgi:hypothetical protein